MPLGRPLAVQLHPSTPQAGDAVVSRPPKLLERLIYMSEFLPVFWRVVTI